MSEYADWFMDNLEANIESYILTFPQQARNGERERLTRIYMETYQKDDNFERWCSNRADFIAEVAHDQAIESAIERSRSV